MALGDRVPVVIANCSPEAVSDYGPVVMAKRDLVAIGDTGLVVIADRDLVALTDCGHCQEKDWRLSWITGLVEQVGKRDSEALEEKRYSHSSWPWNEE